MNGPAPRVHAGVIGAGSMGRNHVRVYDELPGTELVGVHDRDTERSRRVAATFDTEAHSFQSLLEESDVVSVAVPTEHHFQTVRRCIESGVDVLVEKPFVEHASRGRTLVDAAADRDVTLQVGHVERFNPAVQELFSILADLDVRAIDARRLGPPPDREIDDSVVLDLMVHDIDILLQVLDPPSIISAMGTDDGEYATATMQTESGQVASLTASRITQEKVRELTVTTPDSKITVDFIDQSIEICRGSAPEYVRESGSVNYHHETVVENLVVEHREPLKNELASFVEAATTNTEPMVTGEDGLRAIELAHRLEGKIAPRDRSKIKLVD